MQVEMTYIVAAFLFGLADGVMRSGDTEKLKEGCSAAADQLLAIVEYIEGGAVPEWYKEYDDKDESRFSALADTMSGHVMD